VLRLANRTVATLGNVRLEAGGWYSNRTLDHAITRLAGIVDQKEDEIGAFAELGSLSGAERLPIEWVIGVQANSASTNNRSWVNNFGERGALRAQSIQESATLNAWGQLDVGLGSQVRLIAGTQFAAARREVTALLNTVSGRASYRQLSPRFGLLYTPAETVQLFANVSRSFEPPSMADLTAGGISPFAPLDPTRLDRRSRRPRPTRHPCLRRRRLFQLCRQRVHRPARSQWPHLLHRQRRPHAPAGHRSRSRLLPPRTVRPRRRRPCLASGLDLLRLQVRR
jgi:hypothetical protein